MKEFPGEVVEIGADGGVRVSVMHKFGLENNWKWPNDVDAIFYNPSRVVKKIRPPVVVGGRGQFSFNSA